MQSPEGMNDILPPEQVYWQYVFRKANAILSDYGFERIETPIVEHLSLFTKALGENSETAGRIFSFKGKNKEDLCLRPEGTAAIARAYIEQGMGSLPHPIQLWYFGPFFRNIENSDNFRQFYEVGAEIIGDDNAATDAEAIFIAYRMLDSLGLKNLTVRINSTGDQACRSQYIKALKDYYRNKGKKVCKKCQRFQKTDVLRLLACEETSCREIRKDAPQFVDYLDESCKQHFKHVLEFLDETKVPYFLDPYLTKDFDYYTRTIFDIVLEEKDDVAASILCSGGRFDKLINGLGGTKTSAVGFALMVEKTIIALKNLGLSIPEYRAHTKIFIAQLGDLAKRKSLLLFEEFRKHGIAARASFGRDSIKSQLRIAHRLGIKYTLIVGQKEALDGTVILREMDSGVQETVSQERVIEIVKQRFRA